MQQKILLAEHQLDILEPLTAGLNANYFEVITALSGLQALNRARACLPDLIILDSFLPDIDGRAVCDILRRLPSTAPLPIIMLTTWPEQLSRNSAIGAEPDAYMFKPFTPEELAFRVSETLSRWHEPELEREALEHLDFPQRALARWRD
jgi:DNA-binding response OmpR family regulator